jgi:hypothetical protein
MLNLENEEISEEMAEMTFRKWKEKSVKASASEGEILKWLEASWRSLSVKWEISLYSDIYSEISDMRKWREAWKWRRRMLRKYRRNRRRRERRKNEEKWKCEMWNEREEG